MPVIPRCDSGNHQTQSAMMVVKCLLWVLPVVAYGETHDASTAQLQPLVVFETPSQQTASPTDQVIDTRIRFVVSKPPPTQTNATQPLPSDAPRLHLWVDRPRCSCISIDLESDHFQLGETGLMRVHFVIGQFHGMREIDCAVHAALPGSPPLEQDQTIVILIQVPTPITVAPQHLEWGPNDSRVKTMTFTSMVPNAVLTGNDPINPAFVLVPEQCVRTPTQTTLAFRPVMTDRRAIAPVEIHALLGGIQERPCIGYLAYFPTDSP